VGLTLGVLALVWALGSAWREIDFRIREKALGPYRFHLSHCGACQRAGTTAEELAKYESAVPYLAKEDPMRVGH
jgi:hypothetical protein